MVDRDSTSKGTAQSTRETSGSWPFRSRNRAFYSSWIDAKGNWKHLQYIFIT